MASPYRIQGKHISLTYPRCDASLEDLLAFLRNKSFGSRTAKSIIVSSETHEDGGLHRHAYVEFTGRINNSNPRAFDFGLFHPNVQVCRTVEAWKRYVKKDGTFLEWVSDIEDLDLVSIAGRMSKREFLTYAMANRVPYGYYQEALAQANSEAEMITYTDDPDPTLNLPLPRDLDAFDFSDELTNVIVGPTGCGKTFKCLRHMKKPLLFVTHIDQLKYLGTHHRSILFDDMMFTHLPVQSQIHLVDRRKLNATHRRYGHTVIPVGTQVTITCNEIPLTYHPAIARRCHRLVMPDI